MCEPLDDGMERRIDRLTRQVRGLQMSVAGLVAALAVVAFVSLNRTPAGSVQPDVNGPPAERGGGRVLEVPEGEPAN